MEAQPLSEPVSELVSEPEAELPHADFAGEIRTQSEGQAALTEFWRAFCARETRTTRRDDHLNAALKLPCLETALPTESFQTNAQERKSLTLLRHLARDENRFVRWTISRERESAKARLQNPDFAFTRDDEPVR